MIITDDLGGVWGESRRILEKLGKSQRSWEKLGKSRRSWENLGGEGSKCTLAKSKDFAKVCDVILNFIYTAFVATAFKWGD